MPQRLINPKVREEDAPLDRTLRPRLLDEYVGQQQVKDNLRIAMQAAKQRKEPLDHTIFYGPPGLGKTTLAYIIAQEMGVNIRVTSGPAIEKPGEMASLLTVLEPYDVFFIDEVHRLSRVVEEVLYPAMEERRVEFVQRFGVLEGNQKTMTALLDRSEEEQRRRHGEDMERTRAIIERLDRLVERKP